MKPGMLLTLLLVVANSGCTTNCDQAGVAGIYEFKKEADQYELRMENDGTGTLHRNQTQIGIFNWEIEATAEQVFLHASSDVLGVLRDLTNGASLPSGIVETQSGYFGVTPRCRFGNAAKRLDLDVDGQSFFLRANNR